jgi:hypothetical protein
MTKTKKGAIELKEMITMKGTIKTKKRVTKFKETITGKGMTKTRKKATIQGDDHQEGDNQDHDKDDYHGRG